MLRRRIFLQSLAIYLSQGLDWATTTLALRVGGAEGNPIVAGVIARWGVDGWLLVKIAMASMFALVCARSMRGHTVAWALTVMFCAVSLWNIVAISVLLNANLL